jgi:hypothetical protein
VRVSTSALPRGWVMAGLFGRLTPRQLEVLTAVGDHRVARYTLMGDLEPHLVNGRDASWTLLGLTLRGLVVTPSVGAARITCRGRDALTTALNLASAEPGTDRQSPGPRPLPPLSS